MGKISKPFFLPRVENVMCKKGNSGVEYEFRNGLSPVKKINTIKISGRMCIILESIVKNRDSIENKCTGVEYKILLRK